MLNYTEDESKRILAGLKKRGAKPFAGFIYAAFQAYKEVEKANPFALVQQASMASRLYEPESKTITPAEFNKDRRFVGDWLIGCLHHFQRTGDFTLADAQSVYETLLSDLKEIEGSVIPAARPRPTAQLRCCRLRILSFYGTTWSWTGSSSTIMGSVPCTRAQASYRTTGEPVQARLQHAARQRKDMHMPASSHMSLKNSSAIEQSMECFPV